MQPPQDQVTLTIDGQQVSVPKGTLVLHAAAKLGIDIPTFCYSSKMDPLGACRMCLVEIERAKGLPPACATPVAEGMVVRTTSDAVITQQKGMLEFLLINHPLDCPICDKGGECPLQNLTFKYGPGMSRFREEKRHYVKPIPVGPHILLDRERCILCQLCVRFASEVADDAQLVMLNRGDRTEISTYPGQPFDNVFSGNTIELCPVGALTSPEYRFLARPWDLQRTPSTCENCALGCNITLDARRNQLLRLVSRENLAVDDGWLCDHGRFGSLSWASAGRVEEPMVRRNGLLTPVSWEEALSEVASHFAQASNRWGGEAVAGLASAKAANEDLYLLGKLFRAQLESDNIAAFNGSAATSAVLGGAAIADVDQADVVLLFGADPLTRTPVLDLRLKKAFRKRNIKIIVVNTGRTGLDYLAAAKVTVAQSLAEAARQLLDIVQAGPDDTVPAATSAPRDTTGISPDFGRSEDTLATVARLLVKAKRPLVIYDEAILAEDTELLDNLRALSQVGGGEMGADGSAERSRLLALAADANSRGAAEMGAHPTLLPGGQAIDDTAVRRLLRSIWGTRLPKTQGGLNAMEILEAAERGDIKALYLMNCWSLQGAPDDATLVRALSSVDYVVIQTAVITPLMEHADVVLPTLGFAEKTGTLTNTEGRVQSLGKSITGPAEAHDDWEVLAELGRQLGSTAYYESAAEVAAEIAEVSNLPTWDTVGQLPDQTYMRPPRQLVVNR